METTLDILLHPALFMMASFGVATLGLKIYSMTRSASKEVE